MKLTKRTEKENRCMTAVRRVTTASVLLAKICRSKMWLGPRVKQRSS